MKLAIVGSRTYLKYLDFCDKMDEVVRTLETQGESIKDIVTGTYEGTDQLVFIYSIDNRLPIERKSPDMSQYDIKGDDVFMDYNQDLVSQVDQVVAFVAEGSIGTLQVIAEAEKQGKRVIRFDV